MGRVALLPLVFLTLTMRISGSLLPITTPATGELVQQLEEYMKIKVNELKLGLHEAFERDRIRKKRTADALYEVTARDVIKEDQYMVKDAKSETTHPLSKFNISAVTSVGHRENDLLILATYSGSLIILKFDDHYFNVWTTLDGNEVTVKVKHFIYRGQLWLVALQSRKNKYFVQTYNLERNLLHKRQTIVLEGLSDIDLILNNGIFYLGISTYNRQTLNGMTYHAYVKLYEWRHTQFDLVATEPTKGVVSISMWVIDGTLYLVCPQERGDAEEEILGSLVFIYNSRHEKLSYIQIIKFSFPKAARHFSVERNHYVVFVGQKTIVYWWAGDQFLEWLHLPDSEDAIDVSIMTFPSKEVAIVLVYQHKITFYIEDESSVYTKDYTIQFEESVYARSTYFYNAKKYYLAFIVYEAQLKGPSVWKLDVQTYESSSQPVVDPLINCLNNLNHELATQEEKQNYVLRNLDKVWVNNRPQNITAEVIVKGNVMVKGLVNVHEASITTMEPEHVPPYTFREIKDQIEHERHEIHAILEDFGNLVFKSKDQEIIGNIEFTKPVAAERVQIGHIFNDVILNGIPITRLRDFTLKTKGSQVITGDLVFDKIWVDKLYVDNLLNGVNMSDLLLLHGNQTVTGNLKFHNIIVDTDLFIGSGYTLNNVDPRSWVTTNHPQTIGGVKTLKSLNVHENLDVRTTTNGRDLSEIARRAVRLDKEQTITGQLKFEAPLHVDGDMLINGKINGYIDVQALQHGTVDKTSEQEIKGEKVFLAPVYVRGDVEVKGRTNGIKLGTDVVTTNTPQTIYGNFKFEELVSFGENLETGLVNGIDLSEEVILQHGHQVVNSFKVFKESIVVEEDITMEDGLKIDDVDPSEFVKKIIFPDNLTVTEPVVFQNLVINGNLWAREGINGYPIWDLKDALWLKNEEQKIPVPVTFPGAVMFEKELLVDTINGYHMDEFVHTYGEEVITAEKTFIDTVSVEGEISLEDGVTLNGIDISELEKIVVRNEGDYTIHGRKTLKSLEVRGDIIVKTTVNSIDLSEDVMLTDKEQVVTGHLKMTEPVTVKGNVFAKEILVEETVNNVDISDFASNVVFTDEPFKKPLRNKAFVNGFKAKNIQAKGTIDMVNIDEFVRRVVTIDTPQTIGVPKNFTGNLEFKGQLHAQTVNGLNLRDYVDRVVFKNRDEVVRGKKTVKGSVNIEGNLNIDGYLNDVDLPKLRRKAMSKSRPNNISAPMAFVNSVNIGHLIVKEPATLDGVDLQLVAFLDEDVLFTDLNKFTSVVESHGDITVNGLVDGCDLQWLAEHALYLNRTNKPITGRKRFHHLSVNGSMHVDGTINGIDIQRLAEKIVTKSDRRRITGKVHFQKGLEVKELELKDTVNGVNINFIFKDAVRKSVPQVITSSKKFTNAVGIVVKQNLMVEKDVKVFEKVNDVDISELSKITVLTYGEQEIYGRKTLSNIVIHQNMYVGGHVNTIMIPQDLIAVNTTETIYGPTIFLAPVHVEGNLFVRGKLDKTDLNSLLENRVTLSGNEEIHADFTFKNEIHINNLEVDKINDVFVSSIVTTTGSHDIKGFKTFSEDLNISGSLQVWRINGIDLQYLDEHVVRHNRRETITDFTVFHAPLEVVTSVKVVETVNGLDISEMAEFFFYESDQLSQELRYLDRVATEQRRALNHQFEAHKYQISELAYFELVQEIDMASTKFFSIPMYTFYRNVYRVFPINVLVAWRTERTTCDFSEDYCCEVSSTLIFNVAANGTLALNNGPINKRLFPFIFHSSVSNLGYTLWTNTTSSRKRCHHEGVEETLVTPVQGQYWQPDQKGSLNIRNSPYVSDVKIFKVDDFVYLAVSYLYDKKTNTTGNTIIYKHDSLLNKWSIHQTLPTYYAVALDLVAVRDSEKPAILLAVANRLSPEGLSGSSVVYSWSYNMQKFEVLKEVLTSLPSSVLWVDTGDYLFVLFANEKTMLHQNYNWNNLYLEPVNVYLYHYHNLEWVQSINVRGVHSLATFRLAGETYVMAASNHLQLVYLLQWHGFAGFKVVQEIPSAGVEHVHVYWSANEDLMVAVASSTGHTKILKAVIRGTAVTPIEGHPRYMDLASFTNVSYFNNFLLKP